jgi:hypothetical protein
VIRCKDVWRLIKDERGNVESSLVLIPLLFLFLLGIQLILAIGMRDADSLAASDQASTSAISGNFSQSDREQKLESPDRFSNLSILITMHSRKIPQLLPGLASLLGRELETDAKGIAVIENTR